MKNGTYPVWVSHTHMHVTFTVQGQLCSALMWFGHLLRCVDAATMVTLSHSKRFWIEICSLSHKMESRGGAGIWKGHICGPPLCECLPSRTNEAIESMWAVNELLLHTGFLNAHQNNLSKPRDTFLRRLMRGQIGNHFNKMPLGWNCISQKGMLWTVWGETRGMGPVGVLPEVFKGLFVQAGFIALTVLQRIHMQLLCTGTGIW